MAKCKLAHSVGCKNCDETIFIPNFFDIDNINYLLNREKRITEEEFKEFIARNGDGIAGEVSRLISQELEDYF